MVKVMSCRHANDRGLTIVAAGSGGSSEPSEDIDNATAYLDEMGRRVSKNAPLQDRLRK